MPGIKDFVSLKNDKGIRTHVQKRLLLGNINELYILFTSEYPDVKLSISTFTKLRPLHCVLAGSSGTHNVCVCVHHENIKLMMNDAYIQNLTKDTNMILTNYRDCLNAIVCSESTSSCHLNECQNCPGLENLKQHLISVFDNHNIHEVKFEMWLQTDRCTLKTVVVDTDEFIQDFCNRLLKLKFHHFIANEQSSFFKNLKDNLLPDEFMICFDFAENYAFVIQNSAQSFHWNNDQATIFTVVIYYKESGQLKHKSIAIISDNLAHDTAAVYVYQKLILDYLKSCFKPTKVYYCSDGAGQHFKNKSSFANLQAHEKDFGITAEWHYHATSHGKGACDGIGANIKRNARRHSLQCSAHNHLLTPQTLFEWAKNNCKETTVIFSSKDDHKEASEFLKTRFENAVTIPGTLHYHAVIPSQDGKLHLKKFSNSPLYDVFPKNQKRISQCKTLKYTSKKSKRR
ncbi:hypothetical protein ALC57_02985 [Trachymyrmex cornetzi]|uniref:Cc8L18.2-like protein n=2 Tax=Trachymyrmex cornetzi TaxID=471704 RepID=A0A151JMR2_9HYME|nr:hypothetical protein ALC57_02985 [Trachymyrmex cornetzi]